MCSNEILLTLRAIKNPVHRIYNYNFSEGLQPEFNCRFNLFDPTNYFLNW